jgi:hypothetical protein
MRGEGGGAGGGEEVDKVGPSQKNFQKNILNQSSTKPKNVCPPSKIFQTPSQNIWKKPHKPLIWIFNPYALTGKKKNCV